jgi:hypothetical protein
MPLERSKIGAQTVFIDITDSDLKTGGSWLHVVSLVPVPTDSCARADLFLVCRVVVLGRLKSNDNDKSAAGARKLRRPYGVAVLSLSELARENVRRLRMCSDSCSFFSPLT